MKFFSGEGLKILFLQTFYWKNPKKQLESQSVIDLIIRSIPEFFPGNVSAWAPQDHRGWRLRGLKGIPRAWRTQMNTTSKPSLLSVSPLPLSLLHTPSSRFTSSFPGSVPFWLLWMSLSFKPTPGRASESEGHSPPGRVEMSQSERSTLLAFSGRWLGPRDAKHTKVPSTLQPKEPPWKVCPC